MNVIETSGLGKRYRRTWALRDCTLAVPAGHLAALVGPNGAGKTTLMQMLTGLTVPTAGTATVLGEQPPGSPAALDGIAFVAQDAPVYKNMSAGDMLHLTRNLNRRFDQRYAQARLAELGIPMKKKAGKLSGGQAAQLALTLALARRPRLLILDEPLAMLDPLARQDFMATVLTAMAGRGRGGGRGVRAAVLARPRRAGAGRRLPHRAVRRPGAGRWRGRRPARQPPHADWPRRRGGQPSPGSCMRCRSGGPRHRPICWSAASGPVDPVPPGWEAHPVSLEELVLAYLRAPAGAVPPGPSLVQRTEPTEATR